jgi:excisionase family DNA binding protein
MERDVEPIHLLTLDEAAEVLQVSKRTVRRMVDQKEFPAFKVGGQWRVRESEVAKWIQGLSEIQTHILTPRVALNHHRE